MQAYKDKKDVYVEVASIAYNLPYDECKEFRSDGTTNSAGKERRAAAKAIVLGILYGKQIVSIAGDLGIPVERAQQIYRKVMEAFPRLEKFMYDSQAQARNNGFVQTFWGRRRRLVNMQLPRFEYDFSKLKVKRSDPLAFEEENNDEAYYEELTRQWDKQLGACRTFQAKRALIERAAKQGIKVLDNSGYIAEATRQCVNSIVQGTAADMIKKAMLEVDKNERLQAIGFRLLLSVHDELIGEAPIEHVQEASQLFIECMLKAAEEMEMPFKCDATVSSRWYGEEISPE